MTLGLNLTENYTTNLVTENLSYENIGFNDFMRSSEWCFVCENSSMKFVYKLKGMQLLSRVSYTKCHQKLTREHNGEHSTQFLCKGNIKVHMYIVQIIANIKQERI